MSLFPNLSETAPKVAEFWQISGRFFGGVCLIGRKGRTLSTAKKQRANINYIDFVAVVQ